MSEGGRLLLPTNILLSKNISKHKNISKDKSHLCKENWMPAGSWQGPSSLSVWLTTPTRVMCTNSVFIRLCCALVRPVWPRYTGARCGATGPGQDLATYTLATVTGHTDTLGQPGERNLEAETESEEEDVFTKLDVARSGERISDFSARWQLWNLIWVSVEKQALY